MFSCPCSLPISFASHTWWVTNNKGKLNRWEVLFRKSACKTSWTHLHKNCIHPFKGLEIFWAYSKYLWKPNLLKIIEGKKAKLIIRSIENSPKKYPFNVKYNLLGPNSNTFIQWIINKFPESGFKLPWNAIGKKYKF